MQMQLPHSWAIASYHVAHEHVVVECVYGDELPDDDFQRRMTHLVCLI